MANVDGSRTSVFVSDLDRQIDASQVRQIFSPYGEITDISVSGPSKPGQGLNAVITFRTHEQAQTAIRECNYTKVNGVPIHVSWREIDHQRDPNAKLVITNLPPSVEEAELHEALQEYGAVDSVRIRRRATGESTGMAYVQFEAVVGARAAYDALQEATIKGHEIKVDYFRPPNDRLEMARKLPPGYVAVEAVDGGDLPRRETLVELFSRCGEVLDVIVIQSYAVLAFEKQEGAAAAALVSDDRVRVLPALRSAVQQLLFAELERRRVYVCDISESGIAGLPELLAAAGRVVQVTNVSRQKDRSAIVQFDSPEARRRALAELDGSIPEGQWTPIRVLPFLDKRLEHHRAGLLQLNELPPCTPAELRSRFTAFGPIAAVAVAPTAFFLVGFVLFELLDDAQRAREHQVNALVFPLVDDAQLVDAVSNFADKGRGRWLAVYGVEGRAALTAAAGPSVESAWFTQIRGKGAAFAAFRDRHDLDAAAKKLRDSRVKFDLLSNSLLLQTAKLLDQSPRLLGRGHLLFVSGLSREAGNKELREAFEIVGPVEAAVVTVNLDAGTPVGKGVVLFRDHESALAAKLAPPLAGEFGSALVVTDFRGKVDRTTGAPEQPPTEQVIQGPIPRARDVLRAMLIERRNIPKDRMARLVDMVPGLCLDEVYSLLQVPGRLDAWIQNYLA